MHVLPPQALPDTKAAIQKYIIVFPRHIHIYLKNQASPQKHLLTRGFMLIVFPMHYGQPLYH